MKINKVRLSIVLAILLVLYLGSKFFIINVTPSLARGIYLLLPAKDIKRGDIVVFNIPEKLKNCEYIPNYTKLLLKQVGALEDDVVLKKDNILYINNKKYGKIYKKDNLGIDLPQIQDKELQPNKDEFLPLATHINSFDGRYYGVIPINQIKNKAKIIFNFER